jgi:hypothetical protein
MVEISVIAPRGIAAMSSGIPSFLLHFSQMRDIVLIRAAAAFG